MSGPRRAGAAAALLAAAAARAASTALDRYPPGGAERWTRTNHRGEPISLLEGAAFVAGTSKALLVAPGVPPRVRAAALVAVTTAGGLGAYDDLAESSVRKGLAGHLGALARGEVTTGAVKILGLAASGALASALVLTDERRAADGEGTGVLGRCIDVLVGGAVVAGSANLVNLLDLRPGRALKTVLLAAPVLASAPAAAGPAGAAAGAAAALLPQDLAERGMLGDTGANAAGALLGVCLVAGRARAGRLAALAGLVALTVASEKVSFTKVIESTPGLRELDGLGRRPASGT
ncbi:hypothetical protein ACPPVT_09190 [Angustibacter sp. McL0619]|uniref:hypothetical protein n=1 Tax=Angustibacter sp. McL0619 TaxID=3415676 RepID=UPI003CE69C3A